MPPKHKKEETGELMVSVDQFTRTRDSVILSLTNLQTGLTHVQNGLNDLLRAYMQHTASILAGEDGDLDKLQLPANITATAHAAMEAATTAAHGVQQAIAPAPTKAAASAADDKNKKRKREKKEKDPNAPKKPLTAAFLYAQSARPIVRSDLEAALTEGEVLGGGAVNLEVNKRWNELPEGEKEEWRASYRNSMEKWKIDTAEYLAKTGKAAPAQLHDDASEAEELHAADTDASADDDDAAVPPSPPAKAPRANKRQKTAAATSAVNGVAAPASANATTSTPIPVPGSKSSAPTTTEPPTATKKEKKRKEKAPSAATATEEKEPPSTAKKSKSRASARAAEADGDKENAEKDKKEGGEKGAATPATEKKKRSKRKSEVAN